MTHAYIYRTPAQWGSETYYFLESALQEFMDGMSKSFGGIENAQEPEKLYFDEKTGSYDIEDAEYFTAQKLVIRSDKDPSNLEVEWVDIDEE